MRAADPALAPLEARISGNPFDQHAETSSRFAADAAIEAIREGLIRYFVEDDNAAGQRVRELRRRIADRIEADLALLDALEGDTDAEPSLGSIDATSHSNYMSQEAWNLGGGQDREAGDDNGIADEDGMAWAARRVA